MIEQNSESFFVSESLQGKLTPEMLEDQKVTTVSRFSLVSGSCLLEIVEYQERKESLVLMLKASPQQLSEIFDIKPGALNIRCGEIEISKDLDEYELSLSIIRMDEVFYEATLSFEKPSRGIING